MLSTKHDNTHSKGFSVTTNHNRVLQRFPSVIHFLFFLSSLKYRTTFFKGGYETGNFSRIAGKNRTSIKVIQQHIVIEKKHLLEETKQFVQSNSTVLLHSRLRKKVFSTGLDTQMLVKCRFMHELCRFRFSVINGMFNTIL